jgi:hypothetical protein
MKGELGYQSGHAVMERLPVKTTPAIFSGQRAHKHRLASLLYALQEVSLPGDFAEFGVYKGASAYFMEQFLYGDRILHLFDSFEGLPTDWFGVPGYKKGHFTTQGNLPKFRSPNVKLYKGWFSDTVPQFNRDLSYPLSFIHMDADLYQSTMDVFRELNTNIGRDTILLFDEYIMKDTDDEHRALIDWSKEFDREFEYLWRSQSVQVAVRVIK